MKKLFFILFIGLFVANSCSEQTLSESFDLGIDEQFHIGGEYFSNNNSLQFKITEINDSRCPSDVVCVWQGEAVVKISVELPIKGEIELSTFDNLNDTIGSYSFELVGVSPYPISTKSIKLEDYDVTLKIEKLGSN